MAPDQNLIQYIAVRSDLQKTLQWPWGSVIAQACHASVAAIVQNYEAESVKKYLTDLDSMRKVVLEIENEEEIRALAKQLTASGVPHKLWIEKPECIPTCLATQPGPRQHLKPFFRKFRLFSACDLFKSLTFKAAYVNLPLLSRASTLQGATRNVARVPRVKQKHRHLYQILRPKQLPYHPKPTNYRPLPKSLAISGPFRRLLRSRSPAAKEIVARLKLKPYICHESGVRWHPSGGFWVQFIRRNYEKNFCVNCRVLFRSHYFGFSQAKKKAIAFRQRLEAEWEELELQWARIDARREASKKKIERLS